ncbi:MAG: polyprenyl synthetase family protein [Firmicutes bacterium]|jgi:heptaprenyl diphosphate synthase|nr:polyprenyl synthetase family protein [Bacillota bacterium]MDH7494470.1 polyprenyl synthetase family protein [Bacillota bacterium]
MEKASSSRWTHHPELADGLKRVQACLEEQLSTGHKLISDAVMSLLRAGGKRVRPALVLTSGMFGHADPEKLVVVASAVEVVHMATLVHDDIVDDADTRRGIETVQARHGANVAVFTGDYLFTRAFQMLSRYADTGILSSVANAVQQVCEGEIEQYEARGDVTVSFGQYLRRIRQKTAMLFALSCYAGALVAGAPRDTTDTLRRFGLHLGIAFQIADDVLDFSQDEAATGKPAAHDLACGVYTLPVIYALGSRKWGPELRALLTELNATGRDGRDSMSCQARKRVIAAVRESGALCRALQVAERYADRANRCLALLPDGTGKEILADILASVVHRTS